MPTPEYKIGRQTLGQMQMPRPEPDKFQRLHMVDTEPVLYEQIIDQAEEQHWQIAQPDIDIAISLMKAYKAILDKHAENKSLTSAIESRLNEKARQLRAKIYPQ